MNNAAMKGIASLQVQILQPLDTSPELGHEAYGISSYFLFFFFYRGYSQQHSPDNTMPGRYRLFFFLTY